MNFYKHENDKKSGDGLAITEWNTLASAVAGNSGLHLATNSEDKIGIGTKDPTAKLHVIGDLKVTEAATFDGNVGIGTASPSAKLEVNGDVDVKSPGNLSFGPSKRQMINFWGTQFGIGIQSDTQYFRTGNSFAWYKGGSHVDEKLDPGDKGTALMVITDGKVGIGTDKPTEKLHVEGTVKAIKFVGDGSGLTNLSVGETGLVLATKSGNVSIGTENRTANLNVHGDVNASKLKLGSTTISESDLKILLKLATSTLECKIVSGSGNVLDNWDGEVGKEISSVFQEDSSEWYSNRVMKLIIKP